MVPYGSIISRFAARDADADGISGEIYGEFYGLWGIWLMSQVLWWFGDFYSLVNSMVFWGLNGAFEASDVIKRGYSCKNPDKWRFLGGKNHL